MPVYEYNCDRCSIQFEQLLHLSDEVKQYKDGYPCPQCGEIAPRAGISITNFNFKGGTPGNSGVHDIDYPVLDKAVGRSSDKRWSKIRKKHKEIQRIKKETGAEALTKSGDTYVPTDKSVLKIREIGLKTYKKAVEQNKDRLFTYKFDSYSYLMNFCEVSDYLGPL